MVEDLGDYPEGPLEKGMTTSPVFLPGEFHGDRSLQATIHRVRHDWSNLAHVRARAHIHTHTHTHTHTFYITGFGKHWYESWHGGWNIPVFGEQQVGHLGCNTEYILGWPKSLLGIFVTSYGKTWMNFLTNPIFGWYWNYYLKCWEDILEARFWRALNT